MKPKNLKSVAMLFAAGGIWDAIAGLIYIFAIGQGRAIDQPEIHPFYAIFIGSFFLCFAWLQIFSSFNIHRYAFSIGCLIFGRLFYVVVLFAYMTFDPLFPSTFWFTGLIDLALVIVTFYAATNSGLSMREIFLPQKYDHNQS